jgi:xanthine/CO dehydrogenase XdhC/CoxF family maturation factor
MRDVILSILSGLAAAVLGGLVTVFVQFRDWKKREAQSQADLNQQLAVLVEQQKQFQLTFDQRDRELRQRESLLQRELEYQTRETLRQCYRQVLESQRRCRQACLRLAKPAAPNPALTSPRRPRQPTANSLTPTTH